MRQAKTAAPENTWKRQMVRTSEHPASRSHGGRIGRFIRNTGGTTVPEYALVIAILAAGAWIAFIAAGSQASNVLASTSRLTEELAGGQLGSSRDSNPSGQADSALASTEHPLRHTSWTAQHAAVIIGTMAWIATMTVGLLALRIFRSSARGLRASDDATDLPTAGVEPTSYDRLVEKRQQICRLVTRDVENNGSIQARVHHLMSKYVTTVRPSTPVSAASEMMSSLGIRHLLVCDEHGELIGIVSDRDIKNRQGETVQDIMTANPAVAQPNVPIGPAITLMLHRNISCLPVVEQGRLCGVLTTTDVMLSCQCMLHVLESSAPCPKPDESPAPADSGLAPNEAADDASLAAST